MSAILLQNGKQAFTDANGHPLSGGRVFFYEPNTSTPKDTWQDAGETILNTNPIILDARGEAFIFGQGAYRQVLKDASLVQIWDAFIPDLVASVTDTVATLFARTATVVLNVAALRLLDKTTNKNAATAGYYTAGDGGGCDYYYDSTDTTSTDNGGSIIVAADGGRWKQRVVSPVNIRQWGAQSGVLVDNSTQLQASITYAQTNNIAWYVPAGRYKYTTTLQQNRRLFAYGDGGDDSVLEYSGAAEAWLASPPLGAISNNGWSWQNFGIVPATDGGGTYGLRIKLTAAVTPAVCFFADGQITNMVIGAFGSWGVYLDNSVGNTDGFFTSQFEYNTIVNGFLGEKVGDSLHFGHSKLYGKNQFQMTGVPGARQMTIDDMNITTTGGLIALLNVEEASVTDCQLEHPGYLSGYTGSLGAGMVLFNCFKPQITGNTINSDNGAATAPVSPGLPPTTIALTGTTSGAYIEGNDINKGSSFNIQIGNVGVTDTYIGEFNTYYGVAPVIGDGGTGTKRVLYGSASYDPPSLAAGARATTTIAVADTILGMFVEPGFAQNLAGIVLTAWVLSPGTVSVQFYNPTTGAIDLAPAVLRVRCTS